MNHDVFISFSFHDQNAAETLVNYLSSRHGISCWICTRELNGGNTSCGQSSDTENDKRSDKLKTS